MSFTTIVKNEISKLETKQVENITELSAILRNIGVINNIIKVQTENASVARRIYTLLKDTFNISPRIVVRRGFNFNKNYIYIIEIDKKIQNIIDSLELKTSIPKEYIYSDEYLVRAYLRGLFLSVGSINDPKKSRYHLEFMVSSKEYADFVSELLNKFELNSKVLKRENRYMIYVKEAEKIGDFLRLMRAMNAVFYYEDIRIYRDHKNMTNRLNNCEQANVDKIIDSANKQLKDIEKIESIDALELLDDKTKEAAIYRKKYPEVSLAELSEIISLETGNKITKSGLYHRFNKIKEMANKIKK
ncbi:MAG: DNA-binding protein WhiA [Bacilli bacterium]|nr:DNA-binding protein WhiA [Bacilli bacterium]